MNLWSIVVLAAVFGFGQTRTSFLCAQTVRISLESPSLDQWVYPFANSPGGNSYAAVFASLSSAGFEPEFDNRDGQMLAGFDTELAGVPPRLGPNAYTISSASLVTTVESDETFQYDPTSDSYQTWLPPGDPMQLPDDDPGRPVELFLAGYRHGFSASTFSETTPFSPLGSFGKGIRTAYPLTFLGGRCIDASNNIDEHFDPAPIGVALNAGLSPGDPVPIDTELTFEIDVDNADVQRMLRRGLDEGALNFIVASIFPAEQQQTGTYPRFYTKEHLAVLLGLVSAARLDMVVEIATPSASAAGDINLSGAVDVDDLLAVISAWGPCPCCAADVNFDDVVNVDDLLIVINAWG